MPRTDRSVLNRIENFESREDAGMQLAEKLESYKSDNTVVIALPRGGAVLGYEIAKELECPMGLVMVRKISHPTQPEYAIGALVDHDQPIYNKLELSAIDPGWLQKVEQQARELILMRQKQYFSDAVANPKLTGKTVILVDDGMATGLSMEAACQSVRTQNPKSIVVAVPVASAESIEELQPLADDIVILDNPGYFRGSVGAHYQAFPEITDHDVEDILLDAQDII